MDPHFNYMVKQTKKKGTLHMQMIPFVWRVHVMARSGQLSLRMEQSFCGADLEHNKWQQLLSLPIYQS